MLSRLVVDVPHHWLLCFCICCLVLSSMSFISGCPFSPPLPCVSPYQPQCRVFASLVSSFQPHNPRLLPSIFLALPLQPWRADGDADWQFCDAAAADGAAPPGAHQLRPPLALLALHGLSRRLGRSPVHGVVGSPGSAADCGRGGQSGSLHAADQARLYLC